MQVSFKRHRLTGYHLAAGTLIRFPFQVLCVEKSAAKPFIGSHGQQGSVGPISRSPPHLLCSSLSAFPARCKNRPSRRVLKLCTLLLLAEVIGLSQHTSPRSRRSTSHSNWPAFREYMIETLNRIIHIVNSSNKTKQLIPSVPSLL